MYIFISHFRIILNKEELTCDNKLYLSDVQIPVNCRLIKGHYSSLALIMTLNEPININ